MMTCEEVARLVSESIDHKLPWRKRIAMRFHIARCTCCPRLREQLLFLHKALKEYVNRESHGDLTVAPSLSAEAKSRIQQALLHKKG